MPLPSARYERKITRKEEFMMNRIGTELGLVGNRVKRGVRNGRYAVSEFGTKVSEQTRRAARRTDYFVHDNAWPLLGVATGLALVGGFLLARMTLENRAVVVEDAEGKPVMKKRPPVTVGEIIHSLIPLAVLFIKTRQAAKGREVKV